jgi:hypothetical protein
MNPRTIFVVDMALGYFAWALCMATYVWPRLKSMEGIEAHRAIATLHGFRFFGLAFLLPGFVGLSLPEAFARPAAFGDLTTGVLALLALSMVRVRSVFWALVWAFNLVGLADLVMATANAIRSDVPSVAGQLGAGYAIPILLVPALFWTHILALRLLLRPVSVTNRQPATAVTLVATK